MFSSIFYQESNIIIHSSNPSAMVYSEKWIPSPWNKREQQLRKIKDKKNVRERKRKNTRAEEKLKINIFY